MSYAALHVLGALAASFVLGLFQIVVGNWDLERVQKHRLREMSNELGVPLASLENEALVPRMIQYSSSRYSGELLRNRLADLCGLLRNAWGIFGSVLQFVVIGWAGWEMYESGLDNATLMWIAPVLALFFWVMGMAFSLACLLLTGRYPGEPKHARNALAAFIEQRGVQDLSSPPLAKPWER